MAMTDFWQTGAATGVGRLALLFAVSAALLSWALLPGDHVLSCHSGTNASPLSAPQCYFSTSYVHARGLFLQHVREASRAGVPVELHSLALGNSSSSSSSSGDLSDLFVDVAVVRGDPSSVVLHISGTHGPEGYIGSAVQSAWMRRLRESHSKTALSVSTVAESPTAAASLNSTRYASPRPTVVLVHALNAYGMAHYRRWNEDGVDINRNCFADTAERADVMGRDPNIAGYEDRASVFNPVGRPTLLRTLRVVVQAAWLMATDFIGAKRAMVGGTYSRPGCVYFGGQKEVASHLLLRKFLLESGLTAAATRRVAIVDVHSGLGPTGRDTIMLDDPSDAGMASAVRVFNASRQSVGAPRPHDVQSSTQANGDSSAAAAGYEHMRGGTTGCYRGQFLRLERDEDALAVTQEFGTVPAAFVGISLVLENMAFHYGTPEEKRFWGQRVLNAFLVQSQSFMDATMRRGLAVLEQAVEFSSAAAPSPPSTTV